MSHRRLVSLCLGLSAWAILCLPLGAMADVPDSDVRAQIPGNYTVGIYADRFGHSREVQIPEGEQSFECFIGVSGDSMKVFSALVFRIELPLDVTFDGPIVWAPVAGLRQLESVLGNGAIVEFHEECVVQDGDAPAILGRMSVRAGTQVGDFEISPEAHKDFGLSVEICDDANAWPKPFAKALPLKVTRKRSLWQRIQSLFGG